MRTVAPRNVRERGVTGWKHLTGNGRENHLGASLNRER